MTVKPNDRLLGTIYCYHWEPSGPVCKTRRVLHSSNHSMLLSIGFDTRSMKGLSKRLTNRHEHSNSDKIRTLYKSSGIFFSRKPEAQENAQYRFWSKRSGSIFPDTASRGKPDNIITDQESRIKSRLNYAPFTKPDLSGARYDIYQNNSIVHINNLI